MPPSSTDKKKNPWSPVFVGILTFFASPLAGGILLGLNYKRYGLPKRTPRVIFFSFLLLIVLIFLAVIFQDLPFAGEVFTAINLVIAILYGRSQKGFYQIHLATGGKAASIFWPLAICIGTIVLLAGLLAGIALYIDLSDSP